MQLVEVDFRSADGDRVSLDRDRDETQLQKALPRMTHAHGKPRGGYASVRQGAKPPRDHSAGGGTADVAVPGPVTYLVWR